MEVQPRRQRIAGERVDLGGERPRNMGVSQTLADHRAVLALDQRVVIAAPRPRPGHRADVQPVQQPHHRMVDELRAVVAVEVDDLERECAEQILQHRNQKTLRNRLGRTDELHLRHLVYHIDFINALDTGAVALMHRVDAHESGLSARLRPATLADRHRCRPGALVDQASGAIGARLSQVVQMPVGDAGQTLVGRIPEHLELAPKHRPRRRTAHLPQRLVNVRQQHDVRPSVAHPKRLRRPLPSPVRNRTAFQTLTDQTRHLRTRVAGHLAQIRLQQAAIRLAAIAIPEPHHRLDDEPIRRFAIGQ